MKTALGFKRFSCQVCGVDIPPGGIFYIGRLEIISGSDGILPDGEESGDRIIAQALNEIAAAKTEQDHMDEVYQEIKLILCGRCRLPLRDRVLDMIKY